MKTKLCPIFKKRKVKKEGLYRPFCSERCKLIDLGKWASGQYALAGEPIQKEKEDDAVESPDS